MDRHTANAGLTGFDDMIERGRVEAAKGLIILILVYKRHSGFLWTKKSGLNGWFLMTTMAYV